MMFLWRHALWLLLLLPLVAGMYFLVLGRNKAVWRYPVYGLVREAMTLASRLRPHLPPLLLFAGLAALVCAVARPVLFVNSPSGRGTVVLLIDVSLSMAASDVPPTRLGAARAAAKVFVRAQPHDVKIGVVAFGAHADVVQFPTANRDDVLAALDRLELQPFTALGNGLIAALLTIVPTAEVAQGYDIFGAGRAPARTFHYDPQTRKPVPVKAHTPVPPGSDRSAAIILVSDGRGTMGVPAEQAAKLVADFGIRVYTVGVGTLYGGVVTAEGWPAMQAEFDDETLKEIANITGGEYFLARNADRAIRIYERLGGRVVLQRTPHEVTALFVVLGMMLCLSAAALSVMWRGYLPNDAG